MPQRLSKLEGLLIVTSLATLGANFIVRDVAGYVVCMMALGLLLLFQIRESAKVPLVPLAILTAAIFGGHDWANSFGIIFPAWLLSILAARFAWSRLKRGPAENSLPTPARP